MLRARLFLTTIFAIGAISAYAHANELVVRHRKIALTGDPIPDTPFKIGRWVGARPFINNRSQVLFSTFLDGPGFPLDPIPFSFPQAIIRAEADGTLQMIAHEGQELFGDVVNRVRPLAINNKGHVLLHAKLGDQSLDWILLWKGPGRFIPIVHENQVIDLGPVCYFDTINRWPLLNDRDQVLFAARIPGIDCETLNPHLMTIVLREPDGSLRSIAYNGQRISATEELSSVYTATAESQFRFWSRFSLNAAGHVALVAARRPIGSVGLPFYNTVLHQRLAQLYAILGSGDTLPDGAGDVGDVGSAFVAADSSILSTVIAFGVPGRAIVRRKGRDTTIVATDDQRLPNGDQFFSIGNAIGNAAGRSVFIARTYLADGELSLLDRLFVVDLDQAPVEVLRPGTQFPDGLEVYDTTRLASLAADGTLAVRVGLYDTQEDEFHTAFVLVSADLATAVPVAIRDFQYAGCGEILNIRGVDQSVHHSAADLSNGEDGVSVINENGIFAFALSFKNSTGGVFTAEFVERCAGDVNSDGFVDSHDLLQVISALGECIACDEDLNDDGVVDHHDVVIVARNLGTCN